tara:strand:+ start:1424 stop:1864 length:441 start_codon:yes stop_codon:yes gene_type:complete
LECLEPLVEEVHTQEALRRRVDAHEGFHVSGSGIGDLGVFAEGVFHCALVVNVGVAVRGQLLRQLDAQTLAQRLVAQHAALHEATQTKRGALGLHLGSLALDARPRGLRGWGAQPSPSKTQSIHTARQSPARQAATHGRGEVGVDA